MKNKNSAKEIALIMEKELIEDGFTFFSAKKVVEGYYNEKENCFIDTNGIPYHHIIENVEIYGFYEREDLDNLKKIHPLLSTYFLKQNKLKLAKKDKYIYFNKECTKLGVPFIGSYREKNNKVTQIIDGDIYKFYFDNYPTYFNTLSNMSTENDLNEMLDSSEQNPNPKPNPITDINKIYQEITNRVIDQDKPIKKILTAIWKQSHEEFSSKSRNILINGSTGVGKTETFRILSKLIDIPCVITSATEYTASGYVGKSVEDMLVALVRKADYNIEKAQKGILVIDEIDKLSESNKGHSQINQRDVQESLLKILEDGIFNIEIDYKHYNFDTSNLLVVGMGSWSRIDLTPKKAVGFNSKEVKKTYKDLTREDIVKNGIIPELAARFPVLVQMNELNHNSFLKILNSNHNIIELNKQFLDREGITLTVTEDAKEAIAQLAEKNNYGARGLDEIVESTLSNAMFQIAKNPDKYSELIINKDTVESNENYTLIEKNDTKTLVKK